MEIEWIRLLVAFFVGYFLTVSGSLSQIVTQNNLASPSTLGFDGFAVLSILLGQFFISTLHIGLGLESISFLFFLILFIGIFLFRDKIISSSKVDISKNIQMLILLGLGFNLLIGALFSVIQFLFMALNWDFPTGIWFGNFKYVSFLSLWIFLLVFLLLQIFLFRIAPQLRLMSVGLEFAQGLGIKVKQVQKTAVLISLFLTGLVISFYGVFSFLGLIFPHILRLIPTFKYNMRNELIYGPILTGVLFSALDACCYYFDIYGAELPVGMVSSVLGAFVLLILLMRTQILKS